MKVLHVAPRLYPEAKGGTEIHVYELCQDLAQHAEECVVFTTRVSSKNTYKLVCTQKDNLMVYTIELPAQTSKQRVIASLLYSKPFLVSWFIRILIKEKPKVVHFHHLISLSSLFVWICQLLRYNYIIDLVDYWFICPNINLACKGDFAVCGSVCFWEQPKTPIDALIKKIPVKLLLEVYGQIRVFIHRSIWLLALNRNKGTIRSVSKRTSDIYRENGFTLPNLSIISCGIKPFTVVSGSDAKTGLTIGYIGTVMPIKGIETLVSAFNTLTQSTVRLHIYGHSRYPQQDLQTIIAKDPRITYMGNYDHHQIPIILGKIDILVVPSRWEEPYGLVVQEGLQAHIPVIASEIGGIPERIIEGVTGFLVPPANSSALYEKLDYVLHHYDEVRQKLDYSQAQYILEQEVEELQALYTSL